MLTELIEEHARPGLGGRNAEVKQCKFFFFNFDFKLERLDDGARRPQQCVAAFE